MKYFLIFKAFHEAETAMILPVYLVITPVDYSHYPAHRLLSPESQPEGSIRIIEGPVFFTVK